jgi:hypothetical protein
MAERDAPSRFYGPAALPEKKRYNTNFAIISNALRHTEVASAPRTI